MIFSILSAIYNIKTPKIRFNDFSDSLWVNFAPNCAKGTENNDIKIKLIILIYPNEYGNVLTPHPEII